MTDITLEAARKQKIHNLKLKTACLENEELIQEVSFGRLAGVYIMYDKVPHSNYGVGQLSGISHYTIHRGIFFKGLHTR